MAPHPGEETDLSAWKARWPLGRGFERFYGFLGGETNQRNPDLVYDNHPVEQPSAPEEGYHLSKDLADKAIEFIRDAKTVAPAKPWFMYFCPGCAHAPHHVFREWADKYKGRFDMGYEEIRKQILEQTRKRWDCYRIQQNFPPSTPTGNQLKGPEGQPWPKLDFVLPWNSLSQDEQTLFIRMAEVFAGFISYTDQEIGRILDYLEESGQLENTIIIVISDNGASGEGGPTGSFNEIKFFNNVPDYIRENLLRIDELGSPKAYNHYCTGWAWAFDTPFPYWKRFAGYEGGSRRYVSSFPGRRELKHGERCATSISMRWTSCRPCMRCLASTPPEVLKGFTQNPIEGESFAAAIKDPEAEEKEVQFYSMLGQTCSLLQGLACEHHPPPHLRMGQVRARCLGTVQPKRRPGPDA